MKKNSNISDSSGKIIGSVVFETVEGLTHKDDRKEWCYHHILLDSCKCGYIKMAILGENMKRNSIILLITKVIIRVILPIVYAAMFGFCLGILFSQSNNHMLSVAGIILFTLLFVDNIMFSRRFINFLCWRFFQD